MSMKKLLLIIALMIALPTFAQSVMETTYDLQSNGFVSNRMYQNANGNVAIVATMSNELSDASFPDRGTGYNFFDGSNWGETPTSRVEANATGEDMRTGWPSIAPYGKEGEILVNHTSGLNYWIREKAGEGAWDGPHSIPNPTVAEFADIENGMILAWPRVVTTGENNDVVHIFAASSGNETTAQFYVRSTDLVNWDLQYAPLEMDDLHINFYYADDYAVSANGDNIAVVYCAAVSSHVMLYESNDAGLTWESRMVWESPIHGLNWETDENSLFEQLYAPAQVSVAIGKDGVSHVALSVYLCEHKELSQTYGIYKGISTDGVAYWNDTTKYNGVLGPIHSSQDDDPKNALRLWWPSESNSDLITMDPTNFCAWMPPHKDAGYAYFDYNNQYTASDYLGLFGIIAYPSIAVDPEGNLAIAYSAPDVNRPLWNAKYYMRSIFVNYKPVEATSWIQMPDWGNKLYSGFETDWNEATFVSAVSTPVNKNEFWFSCLSDETPGFYAGTGASQSVITTSTVDVFKYVPDYSVKINVAINMSEAGTVTGAATYKNEDEVTLTAIPNEGYRFLNWKENGKIISVESEYSFTAAINRELEAYFVQDGYNEVAVSVYPEGTGSVEGAGIYEENANVTLKALPSYGYVFLNWTENAEIVSTESEYSFVVTTDRNLRANFVLASYNVEITINPENAGVVTGADTYTHGDEVTLTATPNEGYKFLNWTENDEVVSTETEYVFTITEDKTLTAVFVELYDVTLSVNIEEAGAVTGAATYTKGDEVTLTATPNEGYKFLNWTENDTIVSEESKYSFTIVGDRNLVANFVSTESIEELTSSLRIYPNPVNDELIIEAEVEIDEVSIFDIYGRIQNLSNSATQQLGNSIDVSGLNSGVYFVVIKTNENIVTKRFMKK